VFFLPHQGFKLLLILCLKWSGIQAALELCTLLIGIRKIIQFVEVFTTEAKAVVCMEEFSV